MSEAIVTQTPASNVPSLSLVGARRQRRVLSPEEKMRREEQIMNMIEASEKTLGLDDARKTVSTETFPLPLMILNSTPTPKGRMITAMIAPMKPFEYLGVRNFTLVDGLNQIEIMQDIRSREQRERDDAAGRELDSYEILEMDEIDGVRDIDFKYGRARKIYREGQILSVFFGKSLQEERNIDAGIIAVVNWDISCYHKTKVEKEKGTVSVFATIDSVIKGVRFVMDDMNFLIEQANLSTTQFRTEVAALEEYVTTHDTIDQDYMKTKLGYRQTNCIVLPIGQRLDDRLDAIGQPNSCLITECTSRDKKNYLIVDSKSREKVKPENPMLSLSFQVQQWSGERTDNDDGYLPTDTLLSLDVAIFKKQLPPIFKIQSPVPWYALIEPVHGLIRGFVVAKENAFQSFGRKLNNDRITAARNAGCTTRKEIAAFINAPTGNLALSFVASFAAMALLVDGPMFIRSVGFRVSPKRLLQSWGCTPTSPMKTSRIESYVTSTTGFRLDAPLNCLSECAGDNFNMMFDMVDNFEFRMLAAIRPTQKTLQKMPNEDIYDAISSMSPEDGDLFFDFVLQVLAGTEEKYMRRNGDKYADDHPAKRFDFERSDEAKVIYSFAINTKLIQNTNLATAATLREMNLENLLSGEKQPLMIEAASPVSKKRPREESSSDSVSDAKRAKGPTGGKSVPVNPDALDIDDPIEDSDEEEEEDEDDEEEEERIAS